MIFVDQQPLVSVIMGIYNCEKTLARAVESIQKQTYTNWELIMCDDCSSDDTFHTACRIAQEDPRIRVIRNEKNLTLAPTLNRCLKLSTGEYIARMDGDDTCSPTRLEKELAFLETHPEYSVISCNMALSDGQSVFRIVQHKERPNCRDFIFRNEHCHAACMVRAEALKAVAGYSEEKKHYRVEDYELWLRMYRAGYRGYNLQETLYEMLDSSSALKRRSFANRLNESRIVYEACKASSAKAHVYLHVAVPLLKWLVPTGIYRRIHSK